VSDTTGDAIKNKSWYNKNIYINPQAQDKTESIIFASNYQI
jgi:hypothetical protein